IRTSSLRRGGVHSAASRDGTRNHSRARRYVRKLDSVSAKELKVHSCRQLPPFYTKSCRSICVLPIHIDRITHSSRCSKLPTVLWCGRMRFRATKAQHHFDNGVFASYRRRSRQSWTHCVHYSRQAG